MPSSSAFSHIPKIQVAVRKRPLFRKEHERGDTDVIAVAESGKALTVAEPKTKVDLTKYTERHKFVFDYAFNKREDNKQIYARTCRPLVDFFLAKGKATCFAYGQTGSGKTYTMMGPGGGRQSQSGMYTLAAKDIFSAIANKPEYAGQQIYVSFYEIYGGKLFDLLNKRTKVVAREDGDKKVHIVGLTERLCTDAVGLNSMIGHGNGARSTGSTGANADSSRSHAILQLVCKKGNRALGKFSFIDLAGSERAADTFNNDRRTRIEGAEINKSLLALKECIRALDQGAGHRPFRGSKLTQVLKDSLIGNSKTIMIANVSPNSSSVEHTLNTLRYADRVKELKKSQKERNTQVDAYMPHNQKQGGNVRSRPERKKSSNNSAAKNKAFSVMDDDEDGEENIPGLHDEQDELVRTHTDLCTRILREEEQLLEAHRDQIDSTMKTVKKEMILLKQFDTQYNVDEYVKNLDLVLAEKMQTIVDLRSKLAVFKSTLEQEENTNKTLSNRNRRKK